MSKSIYSQRQEILQNLLKSARLDSGLTQVDLANRLERPQSFVSKMESGERILDLLELKDICDALGISLVELTTRFEREVS